jgi:putative transcriptional regulator
MKKAPIGTASSLNRTRRISDADIAARAATDSSTAIPTTDELKQFRRTSLARRIRLQLGLSQPDFAKRFGIPLGTLRDWEQHRAEPDQAARTLLRVIAALPAEVRKVVEAA